MTMTLDGCEDAFVGFADRCGAPRLAVYDYTKLVTLHIKMGMTEDEAIEYIEFNIIGAWVGENAPVIFHPMTAQEARDEIHNNE